MYMVHVCPFASLARVYICTCDLYVPMAKVPVCSFASLARVYIYTCDLFVPMGKVYVFAC